MTYEPTLQEVAEDMVRFSGDDKKIEGYLEGIRRICKDKNLPYYEVFGSKFFNNNVKYLFKEYQGLQTITDLDNGNEWTVR